MRKLLRKNLFFCFLLLLTATAFAAGCATVPDRSGGPPGHLPGQGQNEGQSPFSGLSEQYRLKAREHEKRGDLPKALKAWAVVRSIVPGDWETENKIAALQKQVAVAADQHFQRGLTFFKNKSLALARKEFLRALYLNPDHADALQYLKEKLAGEDFLTYEAKKGERLQEVAQKIYEDPQKDFLIAYFNGLGVDSPLESPRILKMPILDPLPAKRASASAKTAADLRYEKTSDLQDNLAKARGAYAEQNFLESAAFAEKALHYEPANRDARDLMNASYYQIGRILGQEKKYPEALEALQRVDSGYKDTAAQLSQNKKEIADAHYINGVKFFTQEEIEMAIQEWETALTFEPKHSKARNDIESARNLLQKLEKIK